MDNEKMRRLSDEELVNVNGGVGLTINSLNLGDCFSLRMTSTQGTFLMCRNNYPVVQDDTTLEFDMYFDTINEDGYKGINRMSGKTLSNGLYGYDYFHSNSSYKPR